MKDPSYVPKRSKETLDMMIDLGGGWLETGHTQIVGAGHGHASLKTATF